MHQERVHGHHARVLQEILGHPTPRNLEWNDVVGLISNLGEAVERHDGSFEFRVGTASAVFHRPHHKDLEIDDVVRLRQFLTQAGATVQQPAAKTPRSLVLVDHHSARFFESAGGGLVERGRVEPKDPHGYERHLEHRKEADYQGERIPEDDDYYERIAARLKDTGATLLVGDATGKSSAVDYLWQYLLRKHAEIAARISVKHADLSALTTTGSIEAIATSP